MFGCGRQLLDYLVEIGGRGAITDAAESGSTGPPADHNVRGGSLLQIGPARDHDDVGSRQSQIETQIDAVHASLVDFHGDHIRAIQQQR